ncbi:uncharacterized protein DNG_05979 [Cephalotrichum gorgonifer]|uniref:Uncharacterized protein n=1 Tax=Cephalotrichum gorgonifer TaxID=2041049 RepID=A0AAE8N1W2_9PEZI|nr:uncharacterized protein DNG_05979 [Cephalotrichum gorgonifer]
MANITRPEDFGMPEFPMTNLNDEEMGPVHQPVDTAIPQPYHYAHTGPSNQFTTQGGPSHPHPVPATVSIQHGGQKLELRPNSYLEGHANEPGTGAEKAHHEGQRRIELADRPAPIEGPIGPLPLSASPRGTQDGEEEEDEEGREPEFPQQVSHIKGHWTNARKMEKSLWNKVFKKTEKNRTYEVDMPIDSYDTKIVLWDASLECAGDMVRRNRSGWDAVVLCSDASEPTTLDEPFKWWMAFRQDIERSSTDLPIVTEIVALKRDLLSPQRYDISREHGEFAAASFDGAHYSELSAKTRAGLREFWYSLLRQILKGRVEAWMDDVRRSKTRRERLAERKKEYRASTYRALTGERPDRQL